MTLRNTGVPLEDDQFALHGIGKHTAILQIKGGWDKQIAHHFFGVFGMVGQGPRKISSQDLLPQEDGEPLPGCIRTSQRWGAFIRHGYAV